MEELRHGVLLVDKEPGWTSHDVVQKARRLLREKKIGHCGTLDPAATGLLVLTIGRATRLTRFLIRAPKVYEGSLKLGITTDTYDAEGKVLREASTAGLTPGRVAEEMAGFEGAYLQQPPMYSAKKVQGVRLYEIARRGEDVEVEVEPKEVQVYEFQPLAWTGPDSLGFRLACSSGTYARSLVHDLGNRLGCGAHLSSLRRLSVGPFKLESALTLDALADRLGREESLAPAWLPFDAIPLPFGEITTDSTQEQRIANGQNVLVRDLEGHEGDWVKLLNRRRQFIAVGTIIEKIGSTGMGL
ncbi:MAG TPA: tRNA pseudouridine(55) synthase TruB, partial [Thermoanaerobaculia bacterium]|nr:tRNA pseudouridine(55) synthase TruB [Thermoanaerobaculia bacterium]